MARQFATGRLDDLRRTLAGGLGLLVFLVLPAIVTLIAFRLSIVQALLIGGRSAVGRTTGSHEVSELLRRHDVAHPLIDGTTSMPSKRRSRGRCWPRRILPRSGAIPRRSVITG